MTFGIGTSSSTLACCIQAAADVHIEYYGERGGGWLVEGGGFIMLRP